MTSANCSFKPDKPLYTGSDVIIMASQIINTAQTSTPMIQSGASAQYTYLISSSTVTIPAKTGKQIIQGYKQW